MLWGSRCWPLLHAIGGRAGKGSEKLRKDEEREVLWLIRNLESIIPCLECRKHIAEYKKKGIPRSSKEVGKWIWEFHEAVNERLGKSKGPDFSEDLGKNIDLGFAWQNFYETLKKEILLGNCKGKEVADWYTHFKKWTLFL